MRITLLFILIFTITLGALPIATKAQLSSIKAPETIEEAEEFGIQILQALPDSFQKTWKTQVLPLWSNMWNIAKNIWDATISSFVRGLWDQTLSLFGQEIENRKPLFEEEFQREKEQLQQEIEEKLPESSKTLWGLLKRFLPSNEAE
jgi:hypothetical protein